MLSLKNRKARREAAINRAKDIINETGQVVSPSGKVTYQGPEAYRQLENGKKGVRWAATLLGLPLGGATWRYYLAGLTYRGGRFSGGLYAATTLALFGGLFLLWWEFYFAARGFIGLVQANNAVLLPNVRDGVALAVESVNTGNGTVRVSDGQYYPSGVDYPYSSFSYVSAKLFHTEYLDPTYGTLLIPVRPLLLAQMLVPVIVTYLVTILAYLIHRSVVVRRTDSPGYREAFVAYSPWYVTLAHKAILWVSTFVMAYWLLVLL